MTVLTGVLRRLVRDPVFVARMVATRVRDDPVGVGLALSRMAGARGRRAGWAVVLAGARGIMAVRPRSRVAVLAAAFALWETGQTAAALRLATPDRDARSALVLAEFFTRVDRPDVALEMLDPLGDADVRGQRVRARALAAQGDLSDAMATLRHLTPAGRQGARTARLAYRIGGERRVLDPQWRPSRTLAATAGPLPGRVLHLVTNSLPYKPSGYGIRTQRIVAAQGATGLEAAVVTKVGFPAAQGHLSAPTLEIVDGVAYHRIVPRRVPQAPDEVLETNIVGAMDLAGRLRPAVLHAASNHHNARVALALRDAVAAPVVYEVRGFLEETWLQRREAAGEHGADATERFRLTRQIETWCMQQADAVVTIAQTMCDEIVARGVDAGKVVVVPNAVDVGQFDGPGGGAGVRRRLGISERSAVLGYVSSLTGYEGVEYLLDAAALLRSDGRAVHVLVVGDGPHRSVLERHATDAGLNGHVTFTGRVPVGQVRDHYDAVDVFVVPRVDARVTRLVTPLKPFEAMAAGVAVVASRLPALTEIVREGETGLTFAPEDCDDLASTLARLLDDDGERRALAAAGRDWVRRERTWAANADRYASLYASLGVGVTRG